MNDPWNGGTNVPIGCNSYKTYAIIPARIGSTRLPRKPLLKINGLPLVIHCLNSAKSTGLFSDVIVATDAKEILDVVEAHGGKGLLTDKGHPSGTDRVFEAASKLGLGEEDIIVNIQGDQPVVYKDVVEKLIKFLEQRPDVKMSTPACPALVEEVQNPNRVKVVQSKDGLALYFSRAPIPYLRDGDTDPGYLRHIGIYAYRNGFLKQFVSLPQGRLEVIEKLEQLRALEFGHKIGVVLVDRAPLDVDTMEDLKAVEEYLKRSCAN